MVTKVTCHLTRPKTGFGGISNSIKTVDKSSRIVLNPAPDARFGTILPPRHVRNYFLPRMSQFLSVLRFS